MATAVVAMISACTSRENDGTDLVPHELDGGMTDNSLEIALTKDVDVLFVIDNSGSMGDEQGKLAANFPAFINVLEQPTVDANYRIGITTTDNGNVVCNGTSPEGGQLRLRSCTQRADEFTWPKVNPTVMAYDVACAAVCPSSIGDSLSVIPTATANDPQLVPRPWIERIEGVSNIQGGTTTEAFQCFAPQGVDGCGFEAQLESMFKAITRSSVLNEPQSGFLRDEAILAVVHVTDEVDCSANETWQADVFDPALPPSERVFWSDPSAASPTSAICWNAGVSCSGSGGIYVDCQSEDYDETGAKTYDEDDAVLRPVSRYVNLLQAVEDDKKLLNAEQDVLVAVIAGVPLDYEGGQVQLAYQDSPDPMVQDEFGIDYGCQSPAGNGLQKAVPPVRLREFAAAFNTASDGSQNLYSICADDYSGALSAVAERIQDYVRPGCFNMCVADADPSTPTLEPECIVTATNRETGEKSEVPLCEPGGTLPGGEDICFVMKTGDEMHPDCVEEGWNLEFQSVRDPNKPELSKLSLRGTCVLSDFPEDDCPNL